MPIPISQTSVEEADNSFPMLPKPPANLMKDPEFRVWWSAMETWWDSAILVIRDNP